MDLCKKFNQQFNPISKWRLIDQTRIYLTRKLWWMNMSVVSSSSINTWKQEPPYKLEETYDKETKIERHSCLPRHIQVGEVEEFIDMTVHFWRIPFFVCFKYNMEEWWAICISMSSPNCMLIDSPLQSVLQSLTVNWKEWCVYFVVIIGMWPLEGTLLAVLFLHSKPIKRQLL